MAELANVAKTATSAEAARAAAAGDEIVVQMPGAAVASNAAARSAVPAPVARFVAFLRWWLACALVADDAMGGCATCGATGGGSAGAGQ